MEAVFLKVLNMSIITGGLILAVILLRIVFQKAPKSPASEEATEKTTDNSCYFYCPLLSVSGSYGVYELTDTKLILTFKDSGQGEITRVFLRDGEKLVYDREASKRPEIINMTLDDEEIFILSDSDILQDEAEGVMGNKEQYLEFA